MGNIFSHCVSAVARVHGAQGVLESSASASPLQQQQPLTTAKDWFLTQDEIRESRGGDDRPDLSLYTTGDRVTTYASSNAYFADLLADLQALDVDSIWIAGWSLNHTVPLDPTRPSAVETTLQAVIERAVRQRGVHVRALVWANLFTRTECLATRDWMNALGATTTNGSALMLFDNRLPHHVSSHHQKCVVIRRTNGDLVAFMGGLDITVDRWDTLAHDQANFRVQSHWKDEFDGWIDASVRLDGVAARDVAATFAARWNSSTKPANCWKEELLDFENPLEFEPVPKPAMPKTIAKPTVAASQSSLAVQIVRTFSPVRAAATYPGLAPRGERSLLDARLKAIACAKNWIFIEDQYFFTMPQLLTALQSALGSQPALRAAVVVQTPTVTTQSKVAGYEKLLFEMAQPLLSAFAPRFRVYTTKPSRHLYVHAKVVIIDDVFLSIGSANWNRRSMTSDTELCANIVDTELVATPDNVKVGKAVRQFQLTKLQELTGRSVDALRLLTTAERWDAIAQAATDGATILQPLEVEEKWEFVVFTDEFTRHVVDPDDVNRSDGSRSDDEP